VLLPLSFIVHCILVDFAVPFAVDFGVLIVFLFFVGWDGVAVCIVGEH
jgi:hypothetical protein